MHANLMRAPGVEVRPQQIGGIEARQPGEVRPRRPSHTDDCHPLSVSRVTSDRLLDRDALLAQVPPGERRIATNDASRLKLRSKHAKRSVRLRDEQQARSLLIQPVDQSL